MKMGKFETVDEYIASSAPDAQPILRELRTIILKTIPDAKEKISYGVPFYHYFGEFVGYSAYTKHVSFGYGGDVLTEEQQTKLKNNGYRLGKGTMQIRFDQSVPKQQIEEILKQKAAQNRTKKAK